MKIGLFDVDGKNFPNLALMKISAYHKKIGDEVEWSNIGEYDKIYSSKVFTFTPEKELGFATSKEIIKGGTGYGFTELPQEIDSICPDYSIYPQYLSAYGFLTRGCPRSCSWCIVPQKEGNIRPYADISDFLCGRKSAILMDNNVLANDWGLKQIEKMIDLKIKVDFNQGLDARLIADNKDIAQLLTSLKWIRFIRLSCDTLSQMDAVEKAITLIRKTEKKKTDFFVYVLVKDIEDALQRVEFLRTLKAVPFAQPYRDFTTHCVDLTARHFARWVNRRELFMSCTWDQYTSTNRIVS